MFASQTAAAATACAPAVTDTATGATRTYDRGARALCGGSDSWPAAP